MPPAQDPANAGESIPFFTQAATFDQLWPLISRNIDDIARRGKYSHGPKVAEFEKALAAYTGARFAVAVNSGTDALVLLLRAAGLRPGDGVVVPAFTFVASASSVVLAGGRPVFADIDPHTRTLDAASAADVLSRCGARCRFVMPVHMFCHLAALDQITRLAQERGLTVVEDSGAIGDAGAVITDDRYLAETVAALRHHGRFGQTLDHFPGIANATEIPGVNSKMDDIQAAVLLAKLSRLDADIATRGRLAAAYTERLSDLAGVVRLPTAVERRVNTTEVFYVYPIEVRRRDELAGYLTANGIGTETYYPIPLHLQPCFAQLGYRRGDFPHAERACEQTIALPLYPDMGIDDVDRVCATVRRFLTGTRA